MRPTCSLPRSFWGKLYSGASEGPFLDEGTDKVLLDGFMLVKSYDFLCYCVCTIAEMNFNFNIKNSSCIYKDESTLQSIQAKKSVPRCPSKTENAVQKSAN